jgi:YD repeat-containing protein
MKKFLLTLLPAISLFLACKKNNNDITPSPPGNGINTAKIKTEAYGAIITTHTYDAQGRVVKEERSNGSKTEYEYLPGIVNEKSYDNAGVLLNTYTNEINTDGLRTRTTRSNNPGYEELCLYNPDKTLAKTISKNGGNNQALDFFYGNGNVDSIRFTTNGAWGLTVIYTHYTDKPNMLAYENYGYNLLYGKDDKNMLKSVIYKYPDGTTNTPSNYSYEYDAQGRVIKRTSTRGNDIEISLYTYY